MKLWWKNPTTKTLLVDVNNNPIYCSTNPCCELGPITNVCGGIDWKRTFNVTIKNIIDGACSDCSEVVNIVVPVTYTGLFNQSFFVDCTTLDPLTFHVWKSNTDIFGSALCSNAFANRRMIIMVNQSSSPECSCTLLGWIIATDEEFDESNFQDYLGTGAGGNPSDFFLYVNSLNGYSEPPTDPLNLRQTTFTQMTFNACTISTVPVDNLEFSPYAV